MNSIQRTQFAKVESAAVLRRAEESMQTAAQVGSLADIGLGLGIFSAEHEDGGGGGSEGEGLGVAGWDELDALG